jgi:hypothetical protein
MHGLGELRRMNAPRGAFQKRHFDVLAGIIRQARERATFNDTAGEAIDDIAQAMADAFRDDNPGFDRARWDAACGVNGFDHRDVS